MIRLYQQAIAKVLTTKGDKLLAEILEAGELKASDIDRALKTMLDQQRIEYGEVPTSRHDITSGDQPLAMGDTIYVYGNIDLDDL